MDLNKEKTDSGLLNEIKDLMKKKSDKAPKKQEPDDDFDKMIEELDNSENKNMNSPQPQTSPVMEVPSIQESSQTPTEMPKKKEVSFKSEELPSFGESKTTEPKNNQEINQLSISPEKEEIDILVPAPPPELMQEKSPRIDVDRLMNVEEIYLNDKNKKYGGFQIRKEIDPKKPIFIKINNYEKTLMKMIEIKAITSEFSEVIFRLENIHDSQNSNFSTLHNQLEDIQRKMIFVDTLIFEKL